MMRSVQLGRSFMVGASSIFVEEGRKKAVVVSATFAGTNKERSAARGDTRNVPMDIGESRVLSTDGEQIRLTLTEAGGQMAYFEVDVISSRTRKGRRENIRRNRRHERIRSRLGFGVSVEAND